MKRVITYEYIRPNPVVRKEQYTAYCEMLLALYELTDRELPDAWVDLERMCVEFACGPGALQRPCFFLASHEWVNVQTDDTGCITHLRLTPRGMSHKVLLL